ncbi:uncharacterized protein LOC107460346 [Arachis duranensis]|uniref:Uncharacterized protein LOC107460346 n=1 Tax=Arachis duranensis TaxID=130453 RepID=A0A6P4B9D9_ARADU|nr:uncharacterized protein LOC107460346 [Arachis duranensis]
MAWVVELSQYDLQYNSRQAIKAQAIADFLVEVTRKAPDTPSTWWKLHVDGASNQTFGGAGIILENSAGHVPRERNARADLLSKLASTKPGTENRSLIQGLATEPAIILCATLTPSLPSWIDLILRYLERGEIPENEKEAQATRREAPKYVIIQGQLYKRGLHQPLLKCMRPDQMDYVLSEVHEGCCGHHIRGRSLARKLIWTGYYWPTIMSDAREFVKKCKKCQENTNFHKAPPGELSLMMTPRPFAQWGVDLLGSFPPGPGQVKYLIVAIDYYTKWVEAKPLANISSANCQKFMWRQVVTRFGISESIISDNRTQFTDKKFKDFLSGLGIKQKFSSVEHPQSNGQNLLPIIYWQNPLPTHIRGRRSHPSRDQGAESKVTPRRGNEAVKKDLVDETKQMAHLTEIAIKQRIALRYNNKVLKRSLGEGDLVLRRNDIGPPTPGEGKLATNWAVPYGVRKVLGKGAYKLERLDGSEVPRT